MNSRFTSVVRFFLLVAVGFSICISSQPALASKSQTGRLVVQRSPTFGSKTYLQLWIDGNKVANIGPGQGYDESIPAGHHVLAVNYTPRTWHQPTSMRLAVRPGETYAFTAIRESDQGVSFRQSNRIPPCQSDVLESIATELTSNALVLDCSLPSAAPSPAETPVRPLLE